MAIRNVLLLSIWSLVVLSPALSIALDSIVRAFDEDFNLEAYWSVGLTLLGVVVVCPGCILFLRVPAHLRALLYVATVFLLLAQLIMPFIIWPGLTQD